MELQDTRRRTGNVQLYRAQFTFFLDTGSSFTFSSGNKDTYTFEYVFTGLPSGVAFTDYNHSVDLDYTYRYITIDSSCPDASSFSFYVKAYATAHPEAPIYSNTISALVYNPTGTYVNKDLPGLLGLDVLMDGISSFDKEVSEGTHTFTYVTNPSTYLADTNSTLTFRDMNAESVITVDGSTATISEYNAKTLWYHPILARFTFHSGLTGNDIDIRRPIFMLPTASAYQGDEFNDTNWNQRPFSCYDSSNHRGGIYGPGTYDLSLKFYSGVEVPTDTEWGMKVAPYYLYPDDVEVNLSTITGNIQLVIPNTLTAGQYFAFRIQIYKISDPTWNYFSGAFWVEYLA
jgi:hypothetical protein